MPVELRSLSLAVLVLVALSTIAGGDPGLTRAALIGLAIAVAGLLPPIPPMLNGFVAVTAGATLATTALVSGHLGLVALATAPLATASLRFGWRLPLLSLVLAVLGAALIAPQALHSPWVVSRAVAWQSAVVVLVWTTLSLYVHHQSQQTLTSGHPAMS